MKKEVKVIKSEYDRDFDNGNEYVIHTIETNCLSSDKFVQNIINGDKRVDLLAIEIEKLYEPTGYEKYDKDYGRNYMLYPKFIYPKEGDDINIKTKDGKIYICTVSYSDGINWDPTHRYEDYDPYDGVYDWEKAGRTIKLYLRKNLYEVIQEGKEFIKNIDMNQYKLIHTFTKNDRYNYENYINFIGDCTIEYKSLAPLSEKEFFITKSGKILDYILCGYELYEKIH